MAWPTPSTPSNSNRIVAAIDSIYVRPSGELYQTLGAIRDCELVIETYTQSDSKKKNKAFGAMSVTVKATMMQCSLTEIELLDTLIAGTSSFLFKMADAASIPTDGAAATTGWFLFSSSQIGVRPDITFTGDVDKDGGIPLEFSGSLQNSELDAAIKASIDDDEFEATGGVGTFKAIGIYTAAKDGGLPDVTHLKSCGITSITIADTGGAAQTLGPIDEPVIELKYRAEMDSKKVFRTRWVDININYLWKQTDAPNLLSFDAMFDSEVDVVVTLANGIILTLTNRVGIGGLLSSRRDFEETRSIKFTHTGSIQPADIDGIFSV